MAVAVLGANHITSTSTNNAMPNPGWMKSAGVATRRRRQRPEDEHADPGRRSDEHQDRDDEIVTVHRLQIREAEERPVLHVALAPAQIAADELDQGRRVFLPAGFFRQHPHAVTGAAHQHRLKLVVAENVIIVQRRQLAMCDERPKPQHGVVPPIGTAIALPPGVADGVGAHAEPHAELEQARESAGRRQTDNESLQNAEIGVGLHDAHEPQDGVGGHEAVGVEHHGELMLCPPALAEVADVAGLVAGIDIAPPIRDRDPILPS